jgi:hypothetical protein
MFTEKRFLLGFKHSKWVRIRSNISVKVKKSGSERMRIPAIKIFGAGTGTSAGALPILRENKPWKIIKIQKLMEVYSSRSISKSE